jgi:prolyl oligopeptidase
VTSAVRVGEDLFFLIQSFLEPPAWYRYRASEHRLTKTALAKKLSFDTSDIEVLRETCSSKDGTKVPMTILVKRGRAKDGNAPALVTGYGGFAVAIKPRMRAWYRTWLDHDGIVVETNLRGGAELGEAWHRAGMLLSKQNVFDDFAACAKAVVDLGWTKPARIAAYGRSNGGLLMGAALTQHPELFRAVVAQVGIYDMLRSEFTANGQFNVTEYGSVKDEAQFRALYAYSPFHNVKDDTAYPAVLFMTGANDPRVDPFHSRKMVARLQAATSSERPILLRTSESTGHGSGTPLSAEIEETADMLAFLWKELGVTFTR